MEEKVYVTWGCLKCTHSLCTRHPSGMDDHGWVCYWCCGVVSQESNWKMAKITTFYSAKFNSAQQNYPVHKSEMLAEIETMLQH